MIINLLKLAEEKKFPKKLFCVDGIDKEYTSYLNFTESISTGKRMLKLNLSVCFVEQNFRQDLAKHQT
jgi:hypothetical protein